MDSEDSACGYEHCKAIGCKPCFFSYLRAANPDAGLMDFQTLAQHPNLKVRRNVAENGRAPVNILRLLAQDRSPEVRAAVADNHNTPQDTVAMLSQDEHADVRYALAENPTIAQSLLAILIGDDNPYVAQRALRSLELAAGKMYTASFAPKTSKHGLQGCFNPLTNQPEAGAHLDCPDFG